MKKRIIIVDDEPNVRLSYRITLETEGFEIFEANNGNEAFSKIGADTFDLAILDMRMPEMDGLALLEKLRNASIQIPVIIITAYGDIPNAVKAMKLGAIDFLQKPLTPQDLRVVVWEVISRHSAAPRVLTEEDQFNVHFQTTKRLINLREFKLAKEHIAKALALRDNSPDVFNLAGVLFEMLEDFDRARRYYGHAIRLDKNHETAQQNMRRIYELFQFGSSKEPVNLGDSDL